MCERVRNTVTFTFERRVPGVVRESNPFEDAGDDAAEDPADDPADDEDDDCADEHRNERDDARYRVLKEGRDLL